MRNKTDKNIYGILHIYNMRINVKQNISIKKRLTILHRLEYFTDKGEKWHCF